MSKSEYKRLSIQAPELVATIRKRVLREVMDIVLKEPEYIATSQEHRRGYAKAVNQMKLEIEALEK